MVDVANDAPLSKVYVVNESLEVYTERNDFGAFRFLCSS